MLRDGSAVLIDFGLSKQFDDDGNPESSTTIGGGTPGYAPLEQANFHGDTSYGLPMTMDIYALGATMFKMLVGHKPPVASDVLNDGFPAYEFNGKAVSATFVELVKKIMAPLQKERIPDAKTLLAELNQFNCLNEQTIVEERTADVVKPVVGRTNKLVSFLKGNTLSMVAMLAVLIVSLRMCHNSGKNVVYDSDITDTSVSDSVLITDPYEEQADTTLIFEPPQKTSDVKPSPSYNQKPQKSNSQKRNAAIDDDDRIYDVVEQLAQFPGGDTECMKWLAENLKYPPICQKLGVQGRVVVKFVVNRDGSIVDVEIVRSPHPFLSKEAERVVKMMPKWQPARLGNKAVRSRFNLPVMFRLSTRENEIFQNAPKFAKL